MKYIDIQTDDDEKFRQSLNQYNEYLKTIKRRFKKDFFEFYTKIGMHDSILTELKLVKKQLRSKTIINIETHWVNYVDYEKQFSLKFENVRKYITNLDLSSGYSEFGDYILGEFTAIDKKYLSFEFLFYNDSTVYLEFENLIFELEKIGEPYSKTEI